VTCSLGCKISCRAREHGCPSECPALPWQPSIPEGHGVCPACSGTGRVPVPEHSQKYKNVIAGYDKATDTLACGNCGGQKMYGTALGYTKLRQPDDAQGCMHEYVGRNAGHCYTIYTCKHCGDTYDIDSGD